jgi:hypothetical protein
MVARWGIEELFRQAPWMWIDQIRHCERSEAIHLYVGNVVRKMDCFVASRAFAQRSSQ